MSTEWHNKMSIERIGIGIEFERMILDAIRNRLPLFVTAEWQREQWLRWGAAPDRIIMLTADQMPLYYELYSDDVTDERAEEIRWILDPPKFYGPPKPEGM